MQAILKFVDDNHASGRSVTANLVCSHLLEAHHLDVSKRCMHYCMRKLGLQYNNASFTRRNMNGFSPETIREFRIKFDEIHRHVLNGNIKKLFLYILMKVMSIRTIREQSHGSIQLTKK